MDANECRVSCRHHVPGEITGGGEFVCNNAESEGYGIPTLPGDYCGEYEPGD